MPDRNEPSGTYTYPDEASPVDIFVSDAGWTVIRTGWDELIAVDMQGKDRCHIKLLDEAFTKDEVRNTFTTPPPVRCGPDFRCGISWMSAAAIYLSSVRGGDEASLSILLKGRSSRDEIFRAVGAEERRIVLAELARGVAALKKCKKPDGYKPECETTTAAYLAGQIKIAEAVPLLERLEDVAYSGYSLSGVFSKPEGEVDPNSYDKLEFRQIVQLSLRRLGKTPKPLPVYFFEVRFFGIQKEPSVRSKTSVTGDATPQMWRRSRKA